MDCLKLFGSEPAALLLVVIVRARGFHWVVIEPALCLCVLAHLRQDGAILYVSAAMVMFVQVLRAPARSELGEGQGAGILNEPVATATLGALGPLGELSVRAHPLFKPP